MNYLILWRHANLISVSERISKCINFDAMCKDLNATQDVFSMVTNFFGTYFLQVTVQTLPGPQLLSEKGWELQLHEACKLVPFFKILTYRQLQIEEHFSASAIVRCIKISFGLGLCIACHKLKYMWWVQLLSHYVKAIDISVIIHMVSGWCHLQNSLCDGFFSSRSQRCANS